MFQNQSNRRIVGENGGVTDRSKVLKCPRGAVKQTQFDCRLEQMPGGQQHIRRQDVALRQCLKEMRAEGRAAIRVTPP